MHAPGGIRTRKPRKRVAATHALYRAAAGVGKEIYLMWLNSFRQETFAYATYLHSFI
jgi:hypothetical protein